MRVTILYAAVLLAVVLARVSSRSSSDGTQEGRAADLEVHGASFGGAAAGA